MRARTRAIDMAILELEGVISQSLARMIAMLPTNPHLATQIQSKIDLLEDPGLAENIVCSSFFEVDFVSSIDGRVISIVSVFPTGNMRGEATNVVSKIKLAIPILENFIVEPFPHDQENIWYGFRIGASNAGHNIHLEDQKTYESRWTEPMIPYEPTMYHELAHCYIGHESLTQFLEVYVTNLVNTGSINYEDWTVHRAPRENWPWLYAVLDIYQLIGHNAMSNAYRILYSLQPPYGVPLSQECKQAFVDSAPEELKSQVADLADGIEF